MLCACTLLNTSAGFPSSYTEKEKLLDGILEILRLHQQIQWCVSTLGKRGCVLVRKGQTENETREEFNEKILDDLEQQSKLLSTSSDVPVPTKGYYKGNEVIFCTSSQVECVTDTTGCGDAFVGALIFSITQNWPLEQALSYATTVAGLKTLQVGARAALPSSQHPKLLQVINYFNKHNTQ